MLHTLRIRNLALVSDLTVEFGRGYNAITGETGAGKSIIIGALTLALGERADRTQIRTGADTCSVEAVFEPPNNPGFHQLLGEHGIEPCEDNRLLIKRVFTAAGANKQFVNGSPATLALLSNIGDMLADLHGPHEHQSLLHLNRQLAILDSYARVGTTLNGFTEALARRRKLEAEKSALVVDERTYAQQLDLLRHQTNEIEQASLRADEEAEAEQAFQRASNSARLIALTQTALTAMQDEDGSIETHMGLLGRSLHDLARVDQSASAFVSLHALALEQLQDLKAQLENYAEHVDLDTEQLQAAEERLTLIQALKRKYGSSLSEVIAFGGDARRRLDQLESRDVELARLNREIETLNTELRDRAEKLSAERKKAARKLAKAAAVQLADLGFRQSQFEVEVRPSKFEEMQASGLDVVEFMFSPNPGEPLRPLRAIASSGEMARVMLALKTALADSDEVPVLVFDEVDANIGGETAASVGRKMSEIGSRRQVLCITHLAPVAAHAATHLRVAKEVADGRTLTHVETLQGPARIAEIARMLGSADAAGRNHAEALLANAHP